MDGQASTSAREMFGLREEDDTKHVVAFPPEDAAQPGRKRKNDSIRYQIAGQDPGAFVIADREAAGNMG